MLLKFFLNSLGSAFGKDMVQNTLKQLEKTYCCSTAWDQILDFVFISF